MTHDAGYSCCAEYDKMKCKIEQLRNVQSVIIKLTYECSAPDGWLAVNIRHTIEQQGINNK